MLRRIPISLRFDDEESNFYYGFIEQKKNDRELSTLILDLLHAYYEDDIIKERLQFYLDGKSPFIHIHNELERIANEHSRHTVMTKMMGDYTANERKKTIDAEPPASEEVKDENTSQEAPQLLSASEDYDALKKAVKEEVKEEVKQDIIKEVMAQFGLNQLPINNKVEEKVEPVVQAVPKVEPAIEVAPKVETVETVKDVKPAVEVAEKPSVSKNGPISIESVGISQQGSVDSPPKVESVSTEEKVKKPASFGKLLKSVK